MPINASLQSENDVATTQDCLNSLHLGIKILNFYPSIPIIYNIDYIMCIPV